MLWDENYKNYYINVIRKRIPNTFLHIYEENDWFHDWYLKDIYLSNTGKNLINYSKKGSSSLELTLCTSNNDQYVIYYKNVSLLFIDHKTTNDISINSHTGFGRCLVNTFNIVEGKIRHEIVFEGNSKITVEFTNIGIKKIIENYW